MENLYPESGTLLKKWVRILNIVGYFVSDLCGAFAGIMVWRLVQAIGFGPWWSVFAGLAASGLVAGLFLFVVWFTGLIRWTISDAADDAKAARARLDC